MERTFTVSVNNRVYTVIVGDVSRSPVSVQVDDWIFEVELENGVPQRPRPVARDASWRR